MMIRFLYIIYPKKHIDLLQKNHSTVPVRILLLIVFCFILTLASCRKKSVDELLDNARQYVGVRYDTVNVILNEIPFPEKLKGEQQARYCRMKSHCEGYLFASWKVADSLNNISLNYSRMKNDTMSLISDLMFAGQVNLNQDRLDEAIGFYKECLDMAVLSKQDEAILNGKYMLMECYNIRRDYSMALRYAKDLEMYINKSDTLNISRHYLTIARIYAGMEQVDNAMNYYGKSLDGYIFTNDNPRTNADIGNIFGEIARFQLSNSNYAKALNYVNLSLKYRASRGDISKLNFTKARVFMSIDQRDSAKIYLQRTIESSSDEYITIQAYRYLSDLYHIQGNEAQAYYKMLNSRSFFEDAANKLEYGVLLHKYKESVLNNENSELKLAKREREIYLLLGAFVILIIFLIAWIFYLREKKKKNIREQMQLEQHLMDQANIAEKENQLLRKENELIQLREKAAEMRESLFRKMSVSGKIPSLDDENNRDQDLNKRISLNEKDWKELIQTVDSTYNDFASRLKKEYPVLSIEDVGFCCLIKINVSMQDLADIYCISKAGITKKKTRMKKEKFNIEDNSIDLDKFLIRY